MRRKIIPTIAIKKKSFIPVNPEAPGPFKFIINNTLSFVQFIYSKTSAFTLLIPLQGIGVRYDVSYFLLRTDDSWAT